MDGGEAFALDSDGVVAERLGAGVLAHEPDPAQLESVRDLVERHLARTRSRRAAALLERWEDASRHVVRIAPVADAEPAEVGDDVASGVAP